MKFRKILVSVLLAVAMLTSMLSLFSCNKAKVAPEFKMPENGFDTSKKVTITFYHTMGAALREVLDAYIVEFNKLYPNIKIEHKQVGSYDDVRKTISTEITVGDQPNIAYCYPDHVALYNMAKAVQTLDVLIDSDKTVKDALGNETIIGLTQAQKDDFIQGYYEEGRQFGDGKMYTLPLSKSTEVLYYNKTFFEKNDLQVPKTWDELEAVCKRIKEIDPDSIPLGYDSEANWFITMCEQLGSDYTTANGDNNFTFNNQTNRDFVKKFREWYKKGYVTTQEIHGAYTSSLFTMKESEVGNSYMSIGSSAGASHQRPEKVSGAYPFEVGIATVPQVNANNPKVISQGPSLCIFKKADPQEVLASWLFVKYLTTKVEFQAQFSMASGYIPVIKSVKENTKYAEYLNKADGGDYITTLSVKVGLEQEKAYYTSPAFNGSSVARDQVGFLIQRCFVASWKDSEVDDKIKAEFDKAVKECNYQIGK